MVPLKKNPHKMKLESRPQNRKSPTCRQCRDIDPHSRLPGRFDGGADGGAAGGATGGAAPPPVDYFRDWDKNLALDIERMLTKYDGFSAYLAREFSPQKFMLPKRRFWKAEPTFQKAFSKHFSRV
jgi:hypothetical protein